MQGHRVRPSANQRPELRPVNQSDTGNFLLSAWPIFSVNNKKYWKRGLFDWVWVQVNALLLLCNMFALDRCGMGEILDCLKKIKLDINSLKTRVEELSDNQNRSFNKTETDKKENDKKIKTLTKKIDSVKQIVGPISDEYIRKRSVIHEYKSVFSSCTILRAGSMSPKKRKEDCLPSSKKSSCSETDQDSLSIVSSRSSLVNKGEKRSAAKPPPGLTKKRTVSPKKKTSKLDQTQLQSLEPASSISDLFDF